MATTLPAIYEFIAVQGNDEVIPLVNTLQTYMQPTSVLRLTVDGKAYDISGAQFYQIWSGESWSSFAPEGTLGHLKGFRLVNDSSNSRIYAGFDTEGTHSIQVDAIVKSTGNTTSSGIYKTTLTFDSTKEEFSIVEYGTESTADLTSHSEDVVILSDETAIGSAIGVGIPIHDSRDGWTCSFSYVVATATQEMGFALRHVLWTETGFVNVSDEGLSEDTE